MNTHTDNANQFVMRCTLCRHIASLALVSVIATAAGDPRAKSLAAPSPRFKAIAFDAFVLFNPDSVQPEVERVFPGKGREFTNLWRTRQFEYSWLRSLTNRYVDFFAITENALVFASKTMHLPLPTQEKDRLLDSYFHLAPWPDSAAALRTLKESGLRIVILSNFSPLMLRTNAENTGLTPLFNALISTDANHTYKPDPRAYRLGTDRLKLPKEQILFVAFGGWDAAGARAFGYPTFWVNRFNQPSEELGILADGTSTNLDGLIDFVASRQPVAGH